MNQRRGQVRTISFYDGTTLLGSSFLNTSGLAKLSISSLTGGTHSITATYSGNTNYASSTSSPLNQKINPGSTTISLSPSLNPAVYGQTITLSSAITASYGANATGTVQFYDGSISLGIAAVNNNAASLAGVQLSGGSHTLTAITVVTITFSAAHPEQLQNASLWQPLQRRWCRARTRSLQKNPSLTRLPLQGNMEALRAEL